MVDCYNVTALTKSEDDEYDEKIFEARYASQVENTEKNSNNESTEEEDDFVNDMAKRMLQYRQEEEKEIFEILQTLKNILQNISETNEAFEKAYINIVN